MDEEVSRDHRLIFNPPVRLDITNTTQCTIAPCDFEYEFYMNYEPGSDFQEFAYTNTNGVFKTSFTVRIYETQDEYECYETFGDECDWIPPPTYPNNTAPYFVEWFPANIVIVVEEG